MSEDPETIPSMICRACKQPMRVRSRCEKSGKPMTAICPTILCRYRHTMFMVPYGGDGYTLPTEVPVSGI